MALKAWPSGAARMTKCWYCTGTGKQPPRDEDKREG